MKKFLTSLLITAALWFTMATGARADLVAGMPVPQTVLIIHITGGSTYMDSIYNNVRAALTAAGAIITDLAIPAGDADGIWDQMQAQGWSSLDQFCEVWDLRFSDAHPIFTGYTGAVYDDTITCCGGTTDNEIFQQFMLNGGHMYLQGEHQDWPARNMGLLQFIADASGAISYPGVFTGVFNWTSFNSTPENINTDPNTVTQLNTNYPGLITSPGRGHPITYSGGNALDLAFTSADLAIGNGRMFVNFDTNEFSNDTACPGGCYTASTAQEQGYIQNIYDFLSNCIKYNITKAVSPDSICTGDFATYTITFNNIGSQNIPSVVIWDTIPACLTVTGGTPPSGNTGQLYWWNIGTVNSGTTATVNVQVRADCLP